MARPKSEEYKSLTKAELQIMNIIWAASSSLSVSEIQQEFLLLGKEFAYTTVSTIVRILEKKNFLKSLKQGRGHRYLANLSQFEYQQLNLEEVVTEVFQDQPLALVKNLVSTNRLDPEDLLELRRYLDQLNLADD